MAPARPPRPPAGKSLKNLAPKDILKKRATDLIRKVADKDRYAIFLEPVDTDQVDGYTDLISRPMDLSTLQKNLDAGLYRTPATLRADLDLIWSNCCTFNDDNSVYFKEAVRLRGLAARYYDDLVRLLTRDGVAPALALDDPSARAMPANTPTRSRGDPSNTTTPSQEDSEPPRPRARPSRARAAYDAAVAVADAAAERLAAAERAAGLPPTPAAGADSAEPDHPAPAGPRGAARSSLARSSLRARAAGVPEAWQRVGRWHASRVARAPFLSAGRAEDVRAGRAYEAFVERSAPIARRLLATVLDAPAVAAADRAAMAGACAAADAQAAAAAAAASSGRKRPRPRSTEVAAPASGDGRTAKFLIETLGEERIRKASKRSDTLPEASGSAPSKGAIYRLRSLLKQKGLDPAFVNTLNVDDGPADSMGGRSGLSFDGNAGDADEAARAQAKQLGSLLNDNYETMMNVLRLRKLREVVPEAVREDVEDRERECVESAARGLGMAMRNVPPRLLAHPADIAESALTFAQGMASASAAPSK